MQNSNTSKSGTLPGKDWVSREEFNRLWDILMAHINNFSGHMVVEGYVEEIEVSATQKKVVVWTNSGKASKKKESDIYYNPADTSKVLKQTDTFYDEAGKKTMKILYRDFNYATGKTSYICERTD